MREIKFRAWNIKRKKYQEVGRIWFDHKSKTIGALEKCEEEYTIGVNHEGSKKDFILEQYTGIKDKNGNDIYDGDIIKTSFNSIIPVKWFRYGPINNYRLSGWKSIEVIGNIHENPDLLKKEIVYGSK